MSRAIPAAASDAAAAPAEAAPAAAPAPATSVHPDHVASRGMETPSGKGAGDENFPVGSFLLPKALRPHVARFYAFARAIDDVADNPALAPEDKVARLSGFERGLTSETAEPGYETAVRLRESLIETGVTTRHGCDLVSAFKQDAYKLRYADWGELIDYCLRSASPVGRYLLDLHGEDPGGYPQSDALCNALQVINHLQDCQDDYREMDRVYIPQDWLAEHGARTEDLDMPQATEGLRRTLQLCVRETEALMVEARRLPPKLRSLRLALESAVIVEIADQLLRELAARDPLAERVELTKPQFLWCGFKGVAKTLFARCLPRPAR